MSDKQIKYNIMKLIKLTFVGGSCIYVNPEHITYMNESISFCGTFNHTELSLLNSHEIKVEERMSKIIKLINKLNSVES